MRPCRILLAAAAVALMGACRLDIAVDVTLDRHGGGRLAVAVKADEELLSRADAAGIDPLGDLAVVGEGLAGEGWDVADVAADGSRAVTLATDFSDPDELARLSAQLTAALDAPEVRLLEPLVVTVGEDRIELDGHASLAPTAATADLGLLPEDAVRLLREANALGYTVTVSMPGEVISAGGEAIDATTVRYVLEPGEERGLATVGTRPPPPLWPRLAGALLGALAVVGALLALRPSRSGPGRERRR